MKIRWTKKVIFIGLAYIIGFYGLALMWDLWWKSKLPVIATVTAGLLAIFGGFLLAYWLIESDKFAKESQRKKRVLSTLNTFRNSLWIWLFNYACTLSTDYKLHQESERISNRDYRGYKSYIPQLEDIFGIGSSDPKGKRLRGTDSFSQVEFLGIPLGVQSLYQSLNYGLRLIEPIENRVKEFPTLLEEVDPEIATIIHLSHLIRLRIAALQDWENKYGKGNMYAIRGSAAKDLEQKSNLRKVGHKALDIAIAIDKDIDKLEAELR